MSACCAHGLFLRKPRGFAPRLLVCFIPCASSPQGKDTSGMTATPHGFSDVIHNFLENRAFVLALDCYPDEDSNIVRMR
jgi:hypothetical protein